MNSSEYQVNVSPFHISCAVFVTHNKWLKYFLSYININIWVFERVFLNSLELYFHNFRDQTLYISDTLSYDKAINMHLIM